jgi:hypothetical protein
VHQVERVEQRWRHRHGAMDAAAAFLEALEQQQATGQVDAVGSERQGLGEAAAAIGEGHAEGARFAVGTLGRAQEGLALAGGEVLAGAIGGVEAHGGQRRGSGFSPRRLVDRGRPGHAARSW